MRESKKLLCLDFDGVLHSYSSGWQSADRIPDPPVEGALAFLVRASERFALAIFSSRSHQDGGIEAMQSWLRDHLLDDLGWTRGAASRFVDGIAWPIHKPPAHLSIDDRALSFNGDWSRYDLDELETFRPWNKQAPRCPTCGAFEGGDCVSIARGGDCQADWGP